MTTPKRNPRPKLKKVNVSAKEQWRRILREVDKDDIPVNMLIGLDVNLIDGTVVKINIKELLAEGTDPDVLGQMLDLKLKALDDIIKDVSFMVSIDEVANIVQPMTDRILKNL